MGKYLDSRGLVTLWNKIKSYFVDIYDRIESVETNLEGVVYSEDGDASAGYSSTSSIEDRLLPECIIPREDGLYQDRNGIIYPVSHPPLSTLPSILPQSFGTYDIYEVLVSCKNSNKILLIRNLNTYSPFVSFENEINEYNILNNIKFKFDTNVNYTAKRYLGSLIIFDDNNSIYTLSLDNDNRTLNINDTTGGHGPYVVDIFWVDYANDIIPSNATIIEASSFNSNNCVPAICEKINNKWTVRNNENIIPDFTLVRYFIDRNDYYYYYLEKSPSEQRTVIATYTGSEGVIQGFNVLSVWGNSDTVFNVRDIIGLVKVSGDSSIKDLIVDNNSSTVDAYFGSCSMHISRSIGSYSTYDDCPYNIEVKLYAL